MLRVRIHPALRRDLPADRAHELEVLEEELRRSRAAIRPVEGTGDDVDFEIASPPNDTVLFRLRAAEAVVAEVGVREQDLSAHLDAWGLTLRHLMAVDPTAPPHGWRALDYARRTAHDEAAAYLMETLSPIVELDLRAARTLFTLLFVVLRSDPLPGVHRV